MIRFDCDPYDPELTRAIFAATGRICSELQRTMPLAGARIVDWMKQLAGTQEPADYYHHPRGSFMFLFPWFLEKSLPAPFDPALASDLVYSTINGYYYIRLIDNLADGHSSNELKLLPALGFFHTEFQRTYQTYFPADHSFWQFFTNIWYHSADVTLQDLYAVDLSREQFVQVAAQKTCAVKIPLAALCYQAGRIDLLLLWSQFADLFGSWHQMHNDLFHWNEDWSRGATTYFLSEVRRRASSASIPEWVIGHGFEWGINVLDAWMAELDERAKSLGSPELLEYLGYRQELFTREREEVVESLHFARKLKGLIV